MPLYDRPKRAYVITVETVLGHSMPRGAVVHHVDRDRRNGRNDNLVVLQDSAEHVALHRRLRIKQSGGDPWREQFCCLCKRLKSLTEKEFGRSASRMSGFLGYCRECAALRSRAVNNRKHGRPDEWRQSAEERTAQCIGMARKRWSEGVANSSL